MSNNSNSNKGEMTQKGREALERFKMESANELGINLKQGYNGDLTSREAGSIGGSMVNMISPEQQWEIPRNNVKSMGHKVVYTYYIQVGI
ncbi:alpha/beta-type small acid-soluble spore protein [uncultured Ruminococcus sp.]|uniref:alpha/beta-type small acid-soluble spore protein n=1 Tax=uncultured Ruminococcus sp. TaxID=165186 RepID=UPI0025F43FC8|nr:alpha/beta-type small acid-soluble spore protein [uncultured Ruminococcus sp.]